MATMRGLDSPFVLFLYLLGLVALAQFVSLWVICTCSAILLVFKWSRGSEHERDKAYERLLKYSESAHEQVGVESCHWMNGLAEKAWNACLRRQIGPYLAVLQEHMEKSTPGFIRSVTMEGMDVGTRPPIVDGVAVHSFLPDDRVQFTARFRFLPDAHLRLTVGVPHISAGIPILLYQFMMTGTARITLQLHPVAWKRSVVSLSLVGEPNIDFKVNILGGVNGAKINGLYGWIQTAIHNSIYPLMVWPQSMSMSLEGTYLPHHVLGRWAGPPESLFEHQVNLKPIAEIGVVTANEEGLPDGWELLGRTVTGFFPADLNHGSADRELYLCFRRKTEEEGDNRPPINGLCLVYPELGETPPQGFTVVQLTVGGADADLNTGGEPAYLAFSRGEDAPIVDLGLFNETQEHVKPKGYTVLELSPAGRSANFNKSKMADVIYLCYGGGAASPFGFDYQVGPTSERALVRVSAVGAVDLKTYDIGGMCDPYCELYVSSLTGLKEITHPNHKQTAVAVKASNPKWGETFVFKASQNDMLNVVIYDKSRPMSPAKDTVLGVLKFPLDTLVRGVEVRAWYELQLVSQGQALIAVEALNFGLADSAHRDKPLPQMDASKLGSRVRKMRAMADKIIRTNIRTNIPTGIASKLPSGNVASARDNALLGGALLHGSRDNSPRVGVGSGGVGGGDEEDFSFTLSSSAERETDGENSAVGMLSSRGIRWAGEEGSASPAPDHHHSQQQQWSTSSGHSHQKSIGNSPVFAEKKGALEKRSMKGKTGKKVSWSKKFYVLHEGQLSYYRSQKDAIALKSPVSAIDLSDATVIEDHTIVTINTPSQVLVMKAATEQDAQEWTSAIRHNVWMLSPLAHSSGQESSGTPVQRRATLSNQAPDSMP